MKILILIGLIVLLIAGCSSLQNRLLYYPSHDEGTNGFDPWIVDGETIGVRRVAGNPGAIWLILHGNAGQAAARTYLIPKFSPSDSLYILEYPGYGQRKGRPSEKNFNKAARQGYEELRKANPDIPIGVFGESIGSGPASYLAKMTPPPDKIVLVVPFDQLSSVARNHFPSFLVWLVLRDDWDNVAALKDYQGPVEIYGAKDDATIPIEHARILAASNPRFNLILLDGGHNDWSRNEIKIQFP